VMLLIVVEVAGTVCDADCSIFSQTVQYVQFIADILKLCLQHDFVARFN